METEENIVIVGAGIAGLATCLALHRLGLRSIVLESADSLRATGFALALWANAWRALDALGIGDFLRQRSLSITGFKSFSADSGAPIKEVSLVGNNQMDWTSINRGRGRGRSSPRTSQGSSYGSSSSKSPVIQMGRKVLINEKISHTGETSSKSIHLEDISEDSQLYHHMKAYLQNRQEQQSNTFAGIAKEDNDDIKSYEKLKKQEMIFLVENSEIQRKEEPWKILQRYLIKGLYFSGESYKTRSYYETILKDTSTAEFQHFSGYNAEENVYNFSKIIIKQIISIEEWGISTMKERQISLNGSKVNFTYWDYIRVFSQVLYYNNDKTKHTWFIKISAKVFSEPIPNWFLNWWSYHGPSVKILPEPFLKLYREWKQVSPNMKELYKANHICCPDNIDQIYFFIEFSIPWIQKWTPELGFTSDQIPCLYRTFYNNFWDKLLKIDPKSKTLFGQNLLDQIKEKIKEYTLCLKQEQFDDTAFRNIARKINVQDGNKSEMVNKYLEEVKRNLLHSINQMDKSDTSTKSVSSQDDILSRHDGDILDDSQPIPTDEILSEGAIQEAEDFIQQMKKLDKLHERRK